jgi:hypothetical protein
VVGEVEMVELHLVLAEQGKLEEVMEAALMAVQVVALQLIQDLAVEAVDITADMEALVAQA